MTMAPATKPEPAASNVADPVSAGMKSDPVSKLTVRDMASGKDEVLCDPTKTVSAPDDAHSSAKDEEVSAPNMKNKTSQKPVGDHGVYNSPNTVYNYYYPGYSGSFGQADDSGYFQADSLHTAPQPDNGSMVYYLPGYNPYTSGTVVGMDGQNVGQQPYFSPSGYLQHPLPYGSEALPYYSWDSAYVPNVPNGNGHFGDKKYGSGPTFSNSNGLNSAKSNGDTGGKFSKPSTYTTTINPLNKVPPFGSGYSAGLVKGYNSPGKFSSFNGYKQGPFPQNGTGNYRQSGRMWSGNDRNNLRDKPNKNGDFDSSYELTCGPRASNKSAPLDSSAKNEDFGITLSRDQYNLPDFETEYEIAKFFVIKSYNEDDIHKSIKYDVWSSTPNGNKKLNAAYNEAANRLNETGTKCPIFLFFSVNGSGQFVGLAEMVGWVDFNKDMDFWQLDKWNGFFPVKWHVVKDVPNNKLRHIILENNENRSVTFSRDTQEVGLKQGTEMLNIFKSFSSKTSLLDDFDFYEDREKSQQNRKSNKPATLRMEINENCDLANEAAGEMKFADESMTMTATDPSSLIDQTKKLSLNGFSSKSSSVKKQI